MKIKNIAILFFFFTFSIFAQDIPEPPPLLEKEEPAKEIVWDKFEISTNTSGVHINGKTIAPDAKITTISISADHSAALKDGTATITGHNGAKQKDVPDEKFLMVVCGFSHNVGLTLDGRVVCWGYAAHGQCDIPKELTDLKVIAVAAGHSHSLALDEKGKVWAWGDNHCHQLDILPDLPPAVKIDAGENFSIAVDVDGNIYRCGGNEQPTKFVKGK